MRSINGIDFWSAIHFTPNNVAATFEFSSAEVNEGAWERLIKLAYLCEPQLGGTFTYFLRLRPILLEHGIDMRCVTSLPRERLKGTPFEQVDGVECVGCREDDLPGATGQMIEHLQNEQYALVMILPGTDLLSSNLPAYLPRTIRSVIRVPMMTRGAYAPTQAIAPHQRQEFGGGGRWFETLRKIHTLCLRDARFVCNAR